MWPALTILALAALTGLHFWWRKKFLRAQAAVRNELQQHKTLQEKTTLQLRTQQEALFNSMVEGLLLLDQSGRIQLANRAFITLFAQQTDVKKGTRVRLAAEKGRMIITPLKEDELSLKKLLANVTPQNIHAETDWGAPVGKEIW